MGYSIIRFKTHNDEVRWGLLDPRFPKSIQVLPNNYAHLSDLLANGELAVEEMIREGAAESFALEAAEILSPVTAPCNIICQGKNYLDHLLETGTKPKNKSFNILFAKADSSLTGAIGKIVRPPQVKLFDYEIELGLVLKKDISGPIEVHANNLHEYIAGIVIANDLSARDIQVPQGQWFKGKSFRQFCPVGPIFYWLQADDFPALRHLELELRVNGKVRQKSNTAKLMYEPAETLTEISQIMNLRVGDLILTGTPGGVAMQIPKNFMRDLFSRFKSEKSRMQRFLAEQSQSKKYLCPGDKVEARIFSRDGKVNLGCQELEIVAHK